MFSNSGYEHWGIILQFGIISFMLILGNIVRRRVKFFKHLLFPTAIIGGIIGLGVKYLIFGLDIRIGDQLVLTDAFLEGIVYHAIALGFIAMGLKTVKKLDNTFKGKPVKTGLIIVNTYLLQAIVGLLITFGLSVLAVHGVSLFAGTERFSGFLLPMGFGQNAGQASNIGSIFDENGFVGGRTFGLAIAMFGTIWACVAGILYINRRGKEGKVVRAESEETVVQTKNIDIETAGEIPVSEAIDKFSVQVIFVVTIYSLTYLFMLAVTSLIPDEGISRLIWGFNFIFAMLFAIVVKVILNKLHARKIIKRKYTNEYMLDRITGTVFDFMIIASIMAIDIEVIIQTGMWASLLIVTTIGGLATYFYLRKTVKRVYPEYEHEAFITLFGNLTGKAANAIALLREVDPNFKTPAADDLVTGSSTAVMFGAPLLAITAVIYLPEWYFFWGSILVMAIFFTIYSFLILKKPSTKRIKG